LFFLAFFLLICLFNLLLFLPFLTKSTTPGVFYSVSVLTSFSNLVYLTFAFLFLRMDFLGYFSLELSLSSLESESYSKLASILVFNSIFSTSSSLESSESLGMFLSSSARAFIFYFYVYFFGLFYFFYGCGFYLDYASASSFFISAYIFSILSSELSSSYSSTTSSFSSSIYYSSYFSTTYYTSGELSLSSTSSSF